LEGITVAHLKEFAPLQDPKETSFAGDFCSLLRGRDNNPFRVEISRGIGRASEKSIRNVLKSSDG
jgi:hypothetical protein